MFTSLQQNEYAGEGVTLRLAFCVIVEGDEKINSLKELMASVKGVFDGVYITANHEPYTEVEKYCKENGFNFTYLKWNDSFAEQRNFNFSQAKDYDYICWADSDDVIVNAHLIRDYAKIALAQEYDVVFFDYWYSSKFNGKPSLDTYVETELTQKRERLINPRKSVWKKRIHETPVPIDGKNYKYTQIPYSKDYPVVWLHLGASMTETTEYREAKTQRNQRLLEMELEDERKEGEADPRTILYLMKVYAESDEETTLQKCIELGKEYLTKSGWDQERGLCLQLMSKCVGKVGNDKEACDFIFNAIKEYPFNPLFYLYLARTYFNLGDYRKMKHWMQIGLNYDLEDNNTAMNNILEMKMLSAELMLEYYLRGEKNIRKAYDSAKLLNKINPTPNNQQNVDYLKAQTDLDKASENAHKLMDYLIERKQENLVPYVYEAMPAQMKKLPFALKYFNRYSPIKIWKDNEICYFANFGGDHLEKWSGKSLNEGIGGSETAVIRLAEEWVKLGYKVTVYCDPKDDEGEINGVLYLPYYKFNQRDKFNIFIQWRSSALAGKISAKKYLIDLHDVFYDATHLDKLDHIDKFFIKSDYHKTYGGMIPESKFKVISNGIDL